MISDNSGQMLLEGVIEGDLYHVIALLDQSAPLNVPTLEDGNSPLHWAVMNGNKEITELLLRSGADVTAENKLNVTPIQMAASKNKWACVAAIANHQVTNAEDKANFGSALLFATRANQTDLTLLLIHRKAPVSWHMKDTYDTCLHWAARNKNQKIATALLLAGADVNIKNHACETPLHIAAKNGDTALALLLMQSNDASLDQQTALNQSCIELAINNSYLDCAKEMKLYNKINLLPENIKDYFYDATMGVNLTSPVITRQGSTYQRDKLVQSGFDPQTREKISDEDILHNNIIESLIDYYSQPKIDDVEVPDVLRCSLSKNVFVDPVVAVDGETYERKSIEEYLKKNNNITPKGKQQNTKTLYPNQLVYDLVRHTYPNALNAEDRVVEQHHVETVNDTNVGQQKSKNNFGLFSGRVGSAAHEQPLLAITAAPKKPN